MLRNAFRAYVALPGAAGSPRAWQGASQAGRGMWARSLSTPSQSFLGAPTTGRYTLRSSNITNALPRFRSTPLRSTRRNFHNTSRRRDPKNTTREAPGPRAAGTEAQPSGLSARLKKLSKEYGWTAVGVYLALSIADFPFCFLLVRIVGTDKIGELEHWVVSNVKKIIPQSVQDKWHEWRSTLKEEEKEAFDNNNLSEHVEMAGWGVEEAEARNKAEASLGTQLALAYAIHKSFIFIRVPLTAAVLPKVVRVLRSWGYDIGKKKVKQIKP
ncbi:hypothetical protein TruAng_005726 [Truncatella angustata]|nr:hypothetical protein TruAng_005726 [Truncatella angustata]